MEVATLAGPGRSGFLRVERVGSNAWFLVASTASRRLVDGLCDAARAATSPAAALAAAAPLAGDGPAADVVVARMELDACGTWLTVSNAGGPRPVVVRRAGWVDVRGHPAAAFGVAGQAPADDRVGLGPGDSIVLFGPAWCDPTHPGAIVGEAVLDGLLAAAGDGPADQARELAATAPGTGDGADLAVLSVPADLGADPLARVSAATGVPVDDLDLPGYPLGDAQPDLWATPPRPPREARLHVARDAAVLADVRQLLRRLLASWRVADRVEGDDLELLATELASNAIRHSGTTATAIVRFLGDRVRIEVGDGSRAVPVPRDAGPLADGGRGLPLVETLSSAWGVIPTRAGKRVWFEVPVGPPA
jgi:anti-sigma regulatory factor (Ser/Thr protein kinase)